MSATDTLKSAVTNGSFELANAKAGTYKVYIDAAEAIQRCGKDNVQVVMAALQIWETLH